jgi:hypothetical protein
MTNAADLFPMFKGGARDRALLYASVALVSAAVIALQLAIMRIFAVGSWSHFGSLVVSLAMLGFGVSSVANGGGLCACFIRSFSSRR